MLRYLSEFCHIARSQPSAMVDKKKPIGGTVALIHGLSLPIASKYTTTTIYVNTTMLILRVQLVSHFLSRLTVALRFSIDSILFARSLVDVMIL